jgi:hypothetical protein
MFDEGIDDYEDVIEDNYPDYFLTMDYDDDNNRYVLQILDKFGDVDDIIVGMDRIKRYIKNKEERDE